MAITKNPFGVGVSGALVTNVKSICPCCGAEHVWPASPEMRAQKPPCRPCERHDLTMPDTELVALREHQQRLPALLAKARDMTREAKAAETRALNEVQHRRQQVAAALDSRDRYKEIVDAVEADPQCHAGPTISRVRAEQHRRDWEDY